MDRYTARMTQHGTPQRGRLVNRLQPHVTHQPQDN